jgi:hypothetical protein
LVVKVYGAIPVKTVYFQDLYCNSFFTSSVYLLNSMVLPLLIFTVCGHQD